MIFHCANPECPELDLPKTAYGTLAEGSIRCSTCGERVVDETGVEIVGPVDFGSPPPGDIPLPVYQRLEALEAFDSELTAALDALTQRVAALEAGA